MIRETTKTDIEIAKQINQLAAIGDAYTVSMIAKKAPQIDQVNEEEIKEILEELVDEYQDQLPKGWSLVITDTNREVDKACLEALESISPDDKTTKKIIEWGCLGATFSKYFDKNIRIPSQKNENYIELYSMKLLNFVTDAREDLPAKILILSGGGVRKITETAIRHEIRHAWQIEAAHNLLGDKNLNKIVEAEKTMDYMSRPMEEDAIQTSFTNHPLHRGVEEVIQKALENAEKIA